jgi:hypothetical protein
VGRLAILSGEAREQSARRRLTPSELEGDRDQIAFKFMADADEEYEAYVTTIDAVILMSHFRA